MIAAAAVDMADQEPFDFGRSFRVLQENLRRSGPAMVAGYTLIGAIALLGGLGFAFDAWRGTSPWGLLVGLLLGVAVGFYELAKTVFPPR